MATGWAIPICVRQMKSLANNFRNRMVSRTQVKIPQRGKNNEWVIPDDCFEPVESPSVQMHYTGHSHWVLSFQFKDDNGVYSIDSLFANQVIS